MALRVVNMHFNSWWSVARKLAEWATWQTLKTLTLKYWNRNYHSNVTSLTAWWKCWCHYVGCMRRTVEWLAGIEAVELPMSHINALKVKNYCALMHAICNQFHWQFVPHLLNIFYLVFLEHDWSNWPANRGNFRTNCHFGRTLSVDQPLFWSLKR